ncbi:GGDEF domain-containing protein [Dyella sp.]|uniref:GGDEF domain-containing protein n=1 Tax=Dyella sp. TaxID=1869338 RepID=UPI002ED4DE03
MSIDLASVAILGALQASFLAVLLLVATRSYAGVAQASLRIRGWASLLEAAGWWLLGMRGMLGDWWAIGLANGLVIVSYAMTVRAMRMLLGAPSRQRIIVVVSLTCWLVILWYAMVQPDYLARVLWASIVVALDVALLIRPLARCLRAKGSIAERIMLGVLLMSASLLAWRIVDLLFGRAPPGNILDRTFVNTVYMMLTSMQPTFTSIGFLLMYNEAMQADLKRVARIDPLTGVANRLALAELARGVFDRAARGDEPFAVLMLDADHFKRINDRFGHDGGDKVLLTLVDSIRACLGRKEVIGRVGGEEFVVLSPQTTLKAAQELAERIRVAVEHAQLWIEGEVQSLTVSIGVTLSRAQDSDFETVLRRADQALYAAKRAGRNRVMSSPTEPPGQ